MVGLLIVIMIVHDAVDVSASRGDTQTMFFLAVVIMISAVHVYVT